MKGTTFHKNSLTLFFDRLNLPLENMLLTFCSKQKVRTWAEDFAQKMKNSCFSFSDTVTILLWHVRDSRLNPNAAIIKSVTVYIGQNTYKPNKFLINQSLDMFWTPAFPQEFKTYQTLVVIRNLWVWRSAQDVFKGKLSTQAPHKTNVVLETLCAAST